MIKPLFIGNKTFPINIVQGPLAGVSCAPFRRLTWRYSRPAYSCTEMVSCKTLIHQPKRSFKRYIEKDPQEGPVCFQLAGSDPLEIAEAAKRVTEAGADLIDLNCGCPVKKIRSRGAGSSLLTDPLRLYQLILAMKQATHLPVTVKIRVAKNDNKLNQEIAKVVSDAGADGLTVHGRHWTEHYETPCRLDAIRFFVETLKIPVIGNGDVADLASLKTMFATGCAGVMIARAGVGQPWLIAQLTAELQQQRYFPPSFSEIGALYIEHTQGLVNLLGSEKYAVIQARSLAKYYARGLPNKQAFCEAINTCEKIEILTALCADYFGSDVYNNTVKG